MVPAEPFLDSIQVKEPCHVSWNTMTGDERVRHCRMCAKNVYNLSALSRADAENLIREKDGDLCGHFYRRADGTILTADCTPVVVARKRRQAFAILATTVSLFAAAFGFSSRAGGQVQSQTGYGPLGDTLLDPLRGLPFVGPAVDRAFPMPQFSTSGGFTRGIVAVGGMVAIDGRIAIPRTPPPNVVFGPTAPPTSCE